MATVRLVLHVILAGVYVFLTSFTLIVHASSSDPVAGALVLLLLGAWAGASSTLRSVPSLLAAGAGVFLLFLLAVRGRLVQLRREPLGPHGHGATRRCAVGRRRVATRQ